MEILKAEFVRELETTGRKFLVLLKGLHPATVLELQKTRSSPIRGRLAPNTATYLQLSVSVEVDFTSMTTTRGGFLCTSSGEVKYCYTDAQSVFFLFFLLFVLERQLQCPSVLLVLDVALLQNTDSDNCFCTALYSLIL